MEFSSPPQPGPSPAGEILGAANVDQPGTAVARPGQTPGCLRVARPVYGWFTEGFDTKDLREAKALLTELR